ncbi:marR family protein [Bordetella bronchiseptica]|nr:marR family protein [Bordetella bronchiseptica]
MAFSEAAATESGLTAQQHQALLAIKASDDTLSVGELADRLLIRHHSAGELVDRLARMDMVRRIPSNADRRRVLVALTPLAEHTLDALSAAHVEELRSVGPLLRTLLSYFDSPAYRRK